MGDHTEAVQLDYDPQKISFEELLSIFWESHNPSASSFTRQYMNAVFYDNEEQHDKALASKADLETRIGKKVKTSIIPLKSFTLAEDYHQKYLLKNQSRLKNEMMQIYPHHQDFIDSTAVTRLNGYAGGYGTKEQMSEEVEQFGLSSEGRKALAHIVHN